MAPCALPLRSRTCDWGARQERQLGRITAEKLNRARGPAVFVMPLRGVSAIDSAGLQFSWPEADRSYLDALRSNLDPRIRLVEVDAHINDEAFARGVADTFMELMGTRKAGATISSQGATS